MKLFSVSLVTAFVARVWYYLDADGNNAVEGHQMFRDQLFESNEKSSLNCSQSICPGGEPNVRERRGVNREPTYHFNMLQSKDQTYRRSSLPRTTNSNRQVA